MRIRSAERAQSRHGKVIERNDFAVVAACVTGAPGRPQCITATSVVGIWRRLSAAHSVPKKARFTSGRQPGGSVGSICLGRRGEGRAFLALSISALGLHILLGGCARVVDACFLQDLRHTKEEISFYLKCMEWMACFCFTVKEMGNFN